MKETERMGDELIIIWDTFGKKIRMNFLRIGAQKGLSGLWARIFIGLGTLAARTFAEL